MENLFCSACLEAAVNTSDLTGELESLLVSKIFGCCYSLKICLLQEAANCSLLVKCFCNGEQH